MGRFYFTTNDIALMCNVTRQTVINWIKTGKLKANLTPGGHRRVLREDLVVFFRDNRMEEARIQEYEENHKQRIPYCWEYFSIGFASRSSRHECEKCPAKLAKAQRCYVIADLLGDNGRYCNTECSDCAFFKRYSERIEQVSSGG